MPRINLLPWREEERKKRQRDFIARWRFAVWPVSPSSDYDVSFPQMISNQLDRNERLKTRSPS